MNLSVFSSRSFIATKAHAGQRVDKVLQELFPQSSVRSRKALWQQWHITLNGRKTAAGATLCAGDVLRAEPLAQSAESANLYISIPIFLEKWKEWSFFVKPRSLHSVWVRGGGASMEEYLQAHTAEYGELALCNRLDAQTSGIVVTAHTDAGVQLWQHMENAGLCQKRYVALVAGKPQEVHVRAALDTDKRKISRVLKEEAHPLRQTEFIPLQKISVQEYEALRAFFPAFPENMPPEGVCLVGCTIYKGARHQIRAHAAHAGFALWGDTRYAPNTKGEVPSEECFLLHNGALRVDGYDVYCAPVWAEALQDMRVMQDFFMCSAN